MVLVKSKYMHNVKVIGFTENASKTGLNRGWAN